MDGLYWIFLTLNVMMIALGLISRSLDRINNTLERFTDDFERTMLKGVDDE